MNKNAPSLLTDENECATNTHGCQQHCFNVKGKFHCGCKAGYRLDQTDGKSCLGEWDGEYIAI